jgi:hypothetical protein
MLPSPNPSQMNGNWGRKDQFLRDKIDCETREKSKLGNSTKSNFCKICGVETVPRPVHAEILNLRPQAGHITKRQFCNGLNKSDCTVETNQYI